MLNPHSIEIVEGLLNENSGRALRELAALVGDADKAIILQRIYSWCRSNHKRKSHKHFHDDWYWTYNTYQDWQSEMPWLGLRTIQRKIASLEEAGLIITAKHRSTQNNQTKWYRVDYEKLYFLHRGKDSRLAKMANSSPRQNDEIDHAKMARSTTRQNGELSYNIRTTREPEQRCSVETTAASASELGGSSAIAANPNGDDFRSQPDPTPENYAEPPEITPQAAEAPLIDTSIVQPETPALKPVRLRPQMWRGEIPSVGDLAEVQGVVFRIARRQREVFEGKTYVVLFDEVGDSCSIQEEPIPGWNSIQEVAKPGEFVDCDGKVFQIARRIARGGLRHMSFLDTEGKSYPIEKCKRVNN